jgi:hypothetical protein
MTRDSAVLNFSRSFPDRDGICDLTARVLEDTRVPRATHAPLGSQVVHQLFFQHCVVQRNRNPVGDNMAVSRVEPFFSD